nr:immunoglobulin heavy chain junction region [Mus musculus]MBK4196364.1 immunoglobulin heavy chain junction region [Mus musculus]MBK4196365.1 immunoglobulin heavy chain junction region [Mus musculus]
CARCPDGYLDYW